MTALKELLANLAPLRGSAKRLRGLLPTSHPPLIFFVHVPKTAGSTVNSVLHQFLPDGFSHCEAFIDDPIRMRLKANSSAWLSGHVDLRSAEMSLARYTRRPVRYFACMRNPTDHVMSHYNWLIEIFHRGEQFYETHPSWIKHVSETIRSAPQDATSIMANLERFGGLLLNTQSTYILGHRFDWKTNARRRLKLYEMIVDSDNVQSLLEHVLNRTFAEDRRENVSRYHFDPTVFYTEEMHAFLKTRNALDEKLYLLLGFDQRGNA